MNPFHLEINGVVFNPSVPPQAVNRSGGGRSANDRFAIDGTRLVSAGFKAARRVRIASPDDSWVMKTEQVTHLKRLEASIDTFAVTFGTGYEISGEFLACWMEGPAIFRPKRGSPEFSTYDFTIYLL